METAAVAVAEILGAEMQEAVAIPAVEGISKWQSCHGNETPTGLPRGRFSDRDRVRVFSELAE